MILCHATAKTGNSENFTTVIWGVKESTLKFPHVGKNETIICYVDE